MRREVKTKNNERKMSKMQKRDLFNYLLRFCYAFLVDRLNCGTDAVMLTVTPVSPRMHNKNEEPNCFGPYHAFAYFPGNDRDDR